MPLPILFAKIENEDLDILNDLKELEIEAYKNNFSFLLSFYDKRKCKEKEIFLNYFSIDELAEIKRTIKNVNLLEKQRSNSENKEIDDSIAKTQKVVAGFPFFLGGALACCCYSTVQNTSKQTAPKQNTDIFNLKNSFNKYLTDFKTIQLEITDQNLKCNSSEFKKLLKTAKEFYYFLNNDFFSATKEINI